MSDRPGPLLRFIHRLLKIDAIDTRAYQAHDAATMLLQMAERANKRGDGHDRRLSDHEACIHSLAASVTRLAKLDPPRVEGGK